MYRCRKKKSSSWRIAAAPLIPFLVIAHASQAKRRRGKAKGTDASGESRCQPRAEKRSPQHDIVDTAVAAGAFATLATALEAADLIDALKGDGPFTVFAPTDDAFARLPEGALDDLLADKEKLAAVLKYHVVPGRLTAADLRGVERAKTLEGRSLDVDTSLGVRVGSAYVVQADIGCKNGVIHAIDAVLLPE